MAKQRRFEVVCGGCEIGVGCNGVFNFEQCRCKGNHGRRHAGAAQILVTVRARAVRADYLRTACRDVVCGPVVRCRREFLAAVAVGSEVFDADYVLRRRRITQHVGRTRRIVARRCDEHGFFGLFLAYEVFPLGAACARHVGDVRRKRHVDDVRAVGDREIYCRGNGVGIEIIARTAEPLFVFARLYRHNFDVLF